jgi:hypothetical protein
MFPNLIEDLSDGAVDHDYDLIYIDGRKSVRRDIASPQDEPATLSIAHNESGSGANLVLNTVARFDRAVSDENGNRGTISAYVVIRNPLKITDAATVKQTVFQLSQLLTDGTGMNQLINGEI